MHRTLKTLVRHGVWSVGLAGAIMTGCAADVGESALLGENTSGLDTVNCGLTPEQFDLLWGSISLAGTPGAAAGLVGTTLTSMVCGQDNDSIEQLYARMDRIAKEAVDASKLDQLKRQMRNLASRIASHPVDDAAWLASDVGSVEALASSTAGSKGLELQMALAVAAAALGAEALTMPGGDYEAYRSNLIDHLNLSRDWIDEKENDVDLDVRLKAGSFSRIDAHTERRGNFRYEEDVQAGMDRLVTVKAIFDGPDGYRHESPVQSRPIPNPPWCPLPIPGLCGDPMLDSTKAALRDSARNQLMPSYHDAWTTYLGSTLVQRISTTRKALLKISRDAGITALEYTDPLVDEPVPTFAPSLQAEQTFVGTGVLATFETETSLPCTNRCMQDRLCTGGTVRGGQCTLSKGTGSLVAGSPGDYGFAVPTATANQYHTALMINGGSFSGTGQLKNLTTSSSAYCYRMCVTDASCTGGTFNPSTRSCSLRVGSGSISRGASDDYAFVLEGARRNQHYKLRMVPGKDFYGSGLPVRAFASVSAAECYTTCEAEPTCTGGTFSGEYCWLYKGQGPLWDSDSSSRAFVVR